MKKALLSLLLSVSLTYGFAQTANLSDVKKQLQGTWLSHGDSISELVIAQDSITIFRFRPGGVTRCSFQLSTQPCEKLVKFPAATGVYITEKYATETFCCALAELKSGSLIIIYADGTQVAYVNEATMTKPQ
jgi:hypothetical protein